MVSAKEFIEESGNINRPSFFTGEHYDFWNIIMKMFLKSHGAEVWKSVKNGPYIPCLGFNGVTLTKTEDAWDDEDNKKIS